MALNSYVTDRFGGLNVRDDAVTVASPGATNILNVDPSIPNRIQNRDGYRKINTSTPAGSYDNVVETIAGGTSHFVGFRGLNLDKITGPAGVVTAAIATFPANFAAFHTIPFGTPTTSVLYIASSGWTSGVGATLQKWNGAVLANGTGKPAFVSVTPKSNRLAQGRYFAAADAPTGANGSKSAVFFSDEGAPDTYSAGNFVLLQPGDGEEITAMVAWRDLLFVFKETNMFVFYGESPDDDGLPIFDYRRVRLPARMLLSGSNMGIHTETAIAGPDGVYFASSDGIYITTGDTPRLVSDDVRGIFSGTAPDSMRFHISDPVEYNITSVGERIFLSYRTQDQDHRVLVYDRLSQTWTLWGNLQGIVNGTDVPPPINPTSLGVYAANNLRQPFFFSDANIFAFSPESVDDNGTPTAWTYTSGYYDLGSGGEKRLRYTDIYGSGTVTAQETAVGGRTGAITDTGSALTLGTAPAIARARRTVNLRGRLFSHTLSGSGAAVVSRLEHRFAPGSPV